jgi:hypothetical protein
MENKRAEIRIQLVEGDNKVTTSMYLENYNKNNKGLNEGLGDTMIQSLIKELENTKQKSQ